MKKYIISVLLLLGISMSLSAQISNHISYQAVVRDASNKLLANTNINTRISLLADSAEGKRIYGEAHSSTSNAQGVISLKIGNGQVLSGEFNKIDWSKPYFIKVDIDLKGNGEYSLSSIQQLVSVPYALYAKRVENIPEGRYGDLLYWKDSQWVQLHAGKNGQVLGIKNGRPAWLNSTGVDTNTYTDEHTYGSMVDQEGNVYKTIQIGTQTWMAENLRTTTFRDHSAINLVSDSREWETSTTDACAYYANDKSYAPIYGVLYNFNAVNHGKKLCPLGWHVPSNSEWDTLTNYLGGLSAAGLKMKEYGTLEAGTGLWKKGGAIATNESGFSAVPGGCRYDNGFTGAMGEYAYFWSSTPYYNTGWSRGIFYAFDYISRNSDVQFRYGLSVRCIKDTPTE
ncbi:MAG: fibrobacter succinogenes major paralogous domain-containing protein [Bacteroidales bacterium]